MYNWAIKNNFVAEYSENSQVSLCQSSFFFDLLKRRTAFIEHKNGRQIKQISKQIKHIYIR